jgi:hypothetical protein
MALRPGRERTAVDQPREALPAMPEQVAAYVADLTANLAQMARREGLEHLCHLLEMARLEARSAAGHKDGLDPPVR